MITLFLDFKSSFNVSEMVCQSFGGPRHNQDLNEIWEIIFLIFNGYFPEILNVKNLRTPWSDKKLLNMA